MSRRFSTVFTFRLAAVAQGDASIQDQTWTNVGPFGGIITALATHPARRQIKARLTIVLTILFASIFTACQEPKSSSNSSYEWSLLGLEEESINAIAVDPSDDRTIYAGSTINYDANKFGGLFKSIDGGSSWDTLMSGTIIRDIDIHPANPQIIYVLGGGALVSKTTDGGRTWVAADSGLVLGLYGVPGILAIDPLNPETLYMGSNDFGVAYLYKSSDGGLNWKRIGQSDIVYGGVTALAIDPDNSDILYVGTEGVGAILKSTDGGTSWDRLDFPEVGIVNDLLVHPAHPEIVYAGTWRYGFYYSTNGGTTWENANTGLPDTVGVRRVQLSDAGIYIAANDMSKGAAYLRSQDGRWTMVGAQTFVRINTIAVSRRGTVYAGALGIYVLSD